MGTSAASKSPNFLIIVRKKKSEKDAYLRRYRYFVKKRF